MSIAFLILKNKQREGFNLRLKKCQSSEEHL